MGEKKKNHRSRREPRSRVSKATHRHRGGAHKTDLRKVTGANLVTDKRTGEQKLAVTPKGAERLARDWGLLR